MCGVTRYDKVRNEYLRDYLCVRNTDWKIKDYKLRWFGPVERRNDEGIVKKLAELKVEGHLKKGRPKKKWIEVNKKNTRVCKIGKYTVRIRQEWRKDKSSWPHLHGKAKKKSN